jgi:hypothetical protein
MIYAYPIVSCLVFLIFWAAITQPERRRIATIRLLSYVHDDILHFMSKHTPIRFKDDIGWDIWTDASYWAYCRREERQRA